jgi:hypothetical protein
MRSRPKPPFCHGLMIATLQSFIDALRNELQQYGAMLALLEARDASEPGHSCSSLLIFTQEIETQSAALDTARIRRALSQKQLAWALGSPEGESLPKIVPSLPEEYRPLVSALTREVTELLQRLQNCAELNHAQLQRSMELMQRFVTGISPQTKPIPLAEEHILPGADSGPPVAAIV